MTVSLTKQDNHSYSKPWGREEKWAHTNHYVGKLLHVHQGHLLSLQYHELKEETMYIISGKVLFTHGAIGGTLEVVTLSSGDVMHIPPQTVHRIEALEDTIVCEVSTPELDDVIRLQDDYERTSYQ